MATAYVFDTIQPALPTLYTRLAAKLGIGTISSDHDIVRLVEQRLPLTSLDALATHGITDDEISRLILPRRTLVHRRSRKEALSHEESDRAVRLARITSVAERVFGDDAKASRWLRKPKARFAGRAPLELLRTEAGARVVEEMLLQLDFGFAA